MSKLNEVLKDDGRELRIVPHDGRWLAGCTIYDSYEEGDDKLQGMDGLDIATPVTFSRGEKIQAIGSTPDDALRELAIKMAGK